VVENEEDIKVSHQVVTKLSPSVIAFKDALEYCCEFRFIQDIMNIMQLTDRTKYRNKYIKPLIELGVLKMSYPSKPKSPKQKYGLTEKGVHLLSFVKEYYNL